MTIWYTNADSILNKINELRQRIQDSPIKPDIIAITEAKPKAQRYEIQPAELQIDNYEIHSSNMSIGQGRGIVVYTNSELTVVENSLNPFIEYISLTISTAKGESINLLTIYGSPNSTESNNEKLLELLNSIAENEPRGLLIIGDFNFPEIDWTHQLVRANSESTSNRFLNHIMKSFWTQIVDSPTRIRGTENPSLLDLIITNNPDMINEIAYDSPLGNSDHLTLNFSFPFAPPSKSNHQQKYLNFRKANFTKIREEMNMDWYTTLANNEVNEMWEIFYEKIKSAQRKYIPLHSTRKRKQETSHFPINQALARKIKKKHRLWQRFYETKDARKFEDYRKARNQVKNLMRTAKRDYEKKMASHVKENPKVFWKYVNRKFKSRTGIPDLKVQTSSGQKIAQTDKEKAQALAVFFASVMTREDQNNINYTSHPMHPVGYPHILTTIDFDENSIRKKIISLKTNKSPGPDSLTPNILKETSYQTAKAFSVIFQKSIDTGKIPNIWKTSNISPIHKKGNKNVCDNYRPVSLTCIASKLMESIVRDKIMKFLLENNYFTDKQYGFLPGRTATLQLLRVLDEWSEAIDNNQMIEVIYMDFKKAFDSVPHQRLLHKLHHIGIKGQLHDWIKSFLTGRTQRVAINGTVSSPNNVISGIPQGSVLGPLLFVIYVNDLPSHINSSAYLFADDTKIFTKHQNITNISERGNDTIQQDLENLDKWSQTWLLKFNALKCKQMLIHKPRQNPTPTPRFLENEESRPTQLQTTTEERDLGVTIDNHLNFRKHISNITAKARRNMGIIRRTIDNLDKETFLPLYTALVRSHLDYGHSVWSPYQQQDIKQLESVQRHATKKVNGLKNMPYQERLKHLGLTTLKYRRLRGDMIETYKILHEIYDPNVSLTLVRDQAERRGNRYKLYVEGNFRTDIRKYGFKHRIIKHWNKLPNQVVEAKSVNAFKNQLDKHWQHHKMKYDLN